MKQLPFFVLLSLLLLGLGGCSSEQAQEAVNLRGTWEPAVGTRYTESMSYVFKDGNMTMKVDGETFMQSTMRVETQRSVTTEYLSATSKRMIETENLTSNSVNVGGEANEAEVKGPLVGLPILAKLADGLWTYQLESGEATAEQQEALRTFGDSASLKNEVYPVQAVAIGERWEMDAEAIQSLMGAEEVRDAEGKGTMELLDVVTYQGQRCARIAFSIEVFGTSEVSGQAALGMTLKFDGTIYRSLETFHDLETVSSGSLYGTSSQETDGSTLGMVMEGPMSTLSRTTFE
ncbi:MAG: hypothetical protein AAGF10_06030 [Verrucomicrobiota bacterium]